MPNMGTIMPNMGTDAIMPNQNQPMSMVDALFSKTQQSVLALLYGQTKRSFYTNEIIRKSGSGSGAVQRELARLVHSGLVNVTRIGSQKHYQANAEAPIYKELAAIVQKTVGLVGPLKEALKPIMRQIEIAFIYGSVAKKKDAASSDIDLMIISNALTYADVFPVLEDLSHQLGRSIQPTIYSVAELNKRVEADNSFIRRVLNQQKLWLVGEESDLPTG
jgi:predicted nucleotidyltransferase